MTFYFAWVNPSTAFSAGTHSVVDEDIFAFEMTHTEGDLPQLRLDVRNPRINLLDPGRKLWAWLSQDGVAIFYGRLVAMPDNITAEIVTLNFIARPVDYSAQKETLADTLRVLPYFDPIWLNEQRLTDPDVVLEARSVLWHVDRITHVLTTSDITLGEDATATFDEADHLYDNLAIGFGSAPLRRVSVVAEVSWDQIAQGGLNITDQLKGVFKSAGSPKGLVTSYTGQGLEADWPKKGASFKGGWETGKIVLRRLDGISRPARFKKVSVDNISGTTTDPGDTANAVLQTPGFAQFFVWEFKPEFNLTYDTKRKRIEKVTFTLEADVQPLIVDPGEDEVDLLTLSSKAVGEVDPLDPYSLPPIEDVRRRSYMMTDRGQQSLQYLILLARARLFARARAVNVSFETTFALGMDLSCRKSCHIIDPRIPSGEAIGKIIEYTLAADGNGVQRCRVTVGCTIGEGNTATAVGGTPVYVVNGYVNAGYQQYIGQTYEVVASEVTYQDYSSTAIGDDGIDFLNLKAADVILDFFVDNGESHQAGLLSVRYQDIPAAIEALNTDFTECEIDLVNLKGGPFETDFPIVVSQLMIPKTIDL